MSLRTKRRRREAFRRWAVMVDKLTAIACDSLRAELVPVVRRVAAMGAQESVRVRRWEWMPLLAMDAAVRRATRGGCVTGDVVSVSGRGSYPVVVLRPRGDEVTP